MTLTSCSAQKMAERPGAKREAVVCGRIGLPRLGHGRDVHGKKTRAIRHNRGGQANRGVGGGDTGSPSRG